MEQNHQEHCSSQETGVVVRRETDVSTIFKGTPQLLKLLTSLSNATTWEQNNPPCLPVGGHFISEHSNVHITFGPPSIRRQTSGLLLPSGALVNIGVHVSVQVIAASNVQDPPGNSCLACGYSRALSAVLGIHAPGLLHASSRCLQQAEDLL